jgi:GT2 family glycosyltransferase
MDKPLMVSIIVINWNTRDLLKDCLRSVYENSHHAAVEVIVVDNASTDGSIEMIENDFPDVKLIKNDHNAGFSRANNQAVEVSRGEFILFINSDVIVLADSIADMIRIMRNNAEIGALACQSLYTDKKTVQHDCRRFPTIMTALFDNTFLGRWFPENGVMKRYRFRDWAFDDFSEVDQPPMTCLLVRRTVVDAVGLLDEKLFLFFNDVDWCLRINKAGFKIFYMPDAQVVHYASMSVNRFSASYYYWHKDRFYFYRKHYGYHAVLLIKLVLFLDFLERTLKLPIKVMLGRIKNAEIPDHFQSFMRMIRS